ncbi:ethylbenzene dehydrogenase-related protein [Caenispirillum salinarum]|uniref:ethylbenzene dehydrogenase-related protein n=1 Tax=Caenispirillum salinarum TaxID=859058 RepID=UPI00384C9A8C
MVLYERVITQVALAAVAVAAGPALAAGDGEAPAGVDSGLHLVSYRTAGSVAVDGKDGGEWAAAAPLIVTVDELPYKPDTGYRGIDATDVEIRSLHDEGHLYMLFRWADPTLSTARWPWVKQADGGWKQMKALDSTGHENDWYEDKLSVFWHINERGFEKKGCDMSCHIAADGWLDGVRDSSAGRHYTDQPGETLDMWHWKSARTNPVGQADDQFVNDDRKDGPGNWGRNSDIKHGGGYFTNINADKTGPAWMSARGGDSNYVLDAEKVPFDDSRFKAGDMLGGVVAAPFIGPEADVTATGRWHDGEWTLEIRRALVTTGEGSDMHDVQFTDLSKPYHFGVGVFDNTQINHLYHRKAITMTFEPAYTAGLDGSEQEARR